MKADCEALKPSPSRSTPDAWRRGQDVNRFVVGIKKQNGRGLRSARTITFAKHPRRLAEGAGCEPLYGGD